MRAFERLGVVFRRQIGSHMHPHESRLRRVALDPRSSGAGAGGRCASSSARPGVLSRSFAPRSLTPPGEGMPESCLTCAPVPPFGLTLALVDGNGQGRASHSRLALVRVGVAVALRDEGPTTDASASAIRRCASAFGLPPYRSLAPGNAAYAWGAMLLNYLSRPNVRQHGVNIQGEATEQLHPGGADSRPVVVPGL